MTGRVKLDLQIPSRLGDPDAIVLTEPGQEHDALPQHAIPGVSVGVVQALVLIGRPLGEQDCSGIFPAKISAQGLFEGAAEEHRRPSVLFFPAIEVAMPISPRAGEVLADLGVAVGHFRPPAGCPDLPGKVLPNGRREQNRRIGAGKRR